MCAHRHGRYYVPSEWIKVVTLTYSRCSAFINHSFFWCPLPDSAFPPHPPTVLFSETPVDEQPTQKEEQVDDYKDKEEEDEEEYHYVYGDEETEKEDEDEDEDEKKESKMSESQEDKTLQEVKGLYWAVFNYNVPSSSDPVFLSSTGTLPTT